MYRLLIADDEALEREGLELTVERAMPGVFRFMHAGNGRMAIECAEEHRPHIAMLDINMPGIGGLEALRELKERLPDTRFVLVTAYDYFAYAREALSLGVKEYILKPAKREMVVGTLKRLIDEIEREKRGRKEELELRHKISQLMPLAENELALMLMVDQTVDSSASQLSEWLDFRLDRGCAIVAAFESYTDEQDKKKIYDHFRSYVKTHGPDSLVSSLIDHHIAVFCESRPPPETTAGGSWSNTLSASSTIWPGSSLAYRRPLASDRCIAARKGSASPISKPFLPPPCTSKARVTAALTNCSRQRPETLLRLPSKRRKESSSRPTSCRRCNGCVNSGRSKRCPCWPGRNCISRNGSPMIFRWKKWLITFI
ncbi:hypothetical protein HMSSN036_04430 [Paenibacillus macerans]|nr:hypothetical protein HMSSN036_04430 [Paenibacillus macerans]